MERPFFRSSLKPSRPRNIPVQARSSSPKVFSNPIHFVGSEKSKSAAARRIQKAFRGFLVRKSVNKILGIKRQVDATERIISLKDTADLIRKDAKERLKLNEMLMALLFRLDSVRGVDSGVRDCRKAVIKKAIMLQEKLDAIASGDQTLGESQDQKVQLLDSEFNSDSKSPQKFQEKVENSLNTENVDTETLNQGEDAMQIQQADPIQGSPGTKAVEKHDENKMLMERMVEKNDILLRMVADLCERNKMQTQMINSLTKRVDNLEKAFKCERSKRKKRRQIAGSLDAKKP